MATVQEFFDNQDVFVTGGTGFLGKVLIEKLIRSCRGINKLYLLIRTKKGKDINQRISTILDEPLFDLIKKECPESLKKIVPIAGDCTELGLGISESDRKILEENVSIVFHSAASVRFDDTLTYATILNVRGTREVMTLAQNMKNIKALVHVSTSYSNCDKKIVEEKLYPQKADWRKIIEMVETIDEHTLNILTIKLLDKLPNTYIFTKSLAEHVVEDLGHNIPTVIFRPSIVISTLYDPFPGWIDNFNGPVGMLVAGAKGVLRVSYGDPEAIMDYMPVDLAIKIMIVVAWHRANSRNSLGPFVYNGTCGTKKRTSLKKIIDLGLELGKETPFENMLWREYGFVTNNKYRFYWRTIITQLLPAIIVDRLIKMSGRKPFLVRIQRRIYTTQMAIHYFLSNSWTFENNNIFQLRSLLPDSDFAEFGSEGVEFVDDKEYFRSAMIGARTYLMKEKPATLPRCKKHRDRLVWLDKIVRGITYSTIVWLIYNNAFLQKTILKIYSL